MMSRVTAFILWVHAGTSIGLSQHRKNLGEVWNKMQVNGMRVKISSRKKSVAVGEACMAIFWPTQTLKGENL